MENKVSKILVPTDFSQVAESAAIQAARIAIKSKDEVWLFHVIDKETKATLKKNNEDINYLTLKLEKLCKEYAATYNVVFKYKLQEGNIFTTIGEVASEIGATLMVLGTHGVQGMQYITGAYALKVVASSKIPVIIVQKKLPSNTGQLKLVSPIDTSKETKQKTLQTINIARILGAKVYLYKQKGYDEDFENIISLNTNFVKNHLIEHEVPYEIVQQEKANKGFHKDFIAYAKSIEADMIIILTTVEKDLKDMLIGPNEQMVINNEEQIPVMCVNPLQNLYVVERLSSIVNLSF